MRTTIIVMALAFALSGCGNGDAEAPAGEVQIDASAPEVSFKPGPASDHTVKPRGPVQISYRIVGTPIVGQPIAIDLQVQSVLGPQAVTLSYRINDATAMQFPEAQPPSVSISPSADSSPSLQQVRVIPLREGRLYLNVSADVETGDGTYSTVTAIPIQVGGAPVRVPQEHGTVTTDEDGEQVRVLKGEG